LIPSPAPASKNKFPDDLQQWIPWVLYEQEEKMCTLDTGSTNKRYCTWPSSLELDVQPDGAHFTQIWFVEVRSLVPLPGNRPFWPEKVKRNGKNILLSKDQHRPAVWLDPGKHTITGSFSWKTLPESLLVPPETGLIRLTLSGKEIKNLQLDEQGRLWFRQKERLTKDTATKEEISKVQNKSGDILENKIAQIAGFDDPRQIYDELFLRARILKRMVELKIFD